MVKKLGLVIVGVVVATSSMGCQAIKDGLASANDVLMAPPEAVASAGHLGLDFFLSIVGVFIKAFAGGIFGM